MNERVMEQGGVITSLTVNGVALPIAPFEVHTGDRLRAHVELADGVPFSARLAYIEIEPSRWQRLRLWAAAKMQAVMGGGA